MKYTICKIHCHCLSSEFLWTANVTTHSLCLWNRSSNFGLPDQSWSHFHRLSFKFSYRRNCDVPHYYSSVNSGIDKFLRPGIKAGLVKFISIECHFFIMNWTYSSRKHSHLLCIIHSWRITSAGLYSPVLFAQNNCLYDGCVLKLHHNCMMMMMNKHITGFSLAEK